MALENEMELAVEMLRNRGRVVSYTTENAVVDGPPDEGGRLPENPDTGVGERPGTLTLRVTHPHEVTVTENDFAPDTVAKEISDFVETHLSAAASG